MSGPERITAYNEKGRGYSFTAFGKQPHFGPVEYVRADIMDAKDQHIKELQSLLAMNKAKSELYEKHIVKLLAVLEGIKDQAEGAL